MKRFLAKLAIILLAITLAAGLLLFLALDARPLVEHSESISPNAVAQARRLLLANDPRRLSRGDEHQATIPAALIGEGVNYLANRALHGRGALIVGEESAEIRLTLRAPLLPGPCYLNLRATVAEAQGEPRIASAAIGAVPIPTALVEWALASAVRFFGYEQEWLLARSAIRRLAFEPARDVVVVAYVWEPAILDRARAIAFDPADLRRIQAAQTAFAALLDHTAPGAPVALTTVLKPLLGLEGDDRRARRRAAIFVLAVYLAEKDLGALIPEARNWPRPRPVALTLQKRYDFAQHFVISATLSAWAGEPVADAVGLYKELDDIRHGSGFSFRDLAADRAGTRFGELIAQDSERLDAAIQRNLPESEIAPSLAALPEFLHAAEFRRRFGQPGSPAYRQMLAEIERRVAALPLYH